MPKKETGKSKTVSAVVKFTPIALNILYALQGIHFIKFHKELSKSDAVNVLLSGIPDETREEIINKYIANV